MLIIRKFLQKFLDINSYKICFLIGCFLYTFPITSLIMSKIFKVFLLWALIIVLYDMLKNKKLGLHKEGYLLLVMLAIAFLGCFWNYKNNLTSNITTTLYLFVQTICMLLYDKGESEKNIIQGINKLAKIVVTITFICSILSLFIYIFNIKLSVYNGFEEVLIGVFEGRLWSIYGNPNTLGNFSLLSIWLSFILLIIPKYFNHKCTKKTKTILYINIFIQYICILLANSRSTILAALTSLVFLTLFLMCGKLKTKKETPLEYFKKHSIKTSFVTLVVLFNVIVLSIIIKYSIPMISVSIKTVSTTYTTLINNNNNNSNGNNTKPSTNTFKEELEKIQRQNNGSDVSNGRFELWTGALKVWQKHPVLGVGFKNVNANINKYLSKELLVTSPKLSENTHNIYLEILISSGSIAFILFVIYFIIVMLKYFSYLLKYTQTNIYKYELVLYNFIILFSLLIINLFDSNILFFFSLFIVPIFWMTNCNIEKLLKIEDKNNKKNVLFLIDSLAGGGAEKVLIDLTNNLDYSKYNIEVKTIYNEGFYLKQLNSNIEYSSFIKKANIWKKRIVNRLIKYLPSRVMYDLIITKQYDVEIAFLEFLATKVLSGSNSNANKIAWVHADIFTLKKGTSLYRNKKSLIKSYQNFNKIVNVSDLTKAAFCKETNLYQNAITIYNPIDKKQILTKAKEHCDIKKDKTKFTIISIGRLTYQKGYMLLCEVINKLVKDYKNIELWILGEGEERKNLEEFINKNNLQKYIKLLGFQENPYKYLNQADLFVSSSYTEGFSLVLAEAVTLEIPILSTSTTGSNNILGFGKYGKIVECDFDDLYNELKEIITDPKELKKLKEKVKLRKDFLDLDSKVKEVENIIDNDIRIEDKKIFCTVFTPAYNRAHLIPRLYESLKKQTNKNFEWVVVDDGSTDGTDKLFEKYLKDKNDFKITYFKQENGGKHRAINKGLDLAKGKLFFIVDSDDYLLDFAIEKLYKYEQSIKGLTNFAGVSGLKGYSEDKVVGGFNNKEYIDVYNNERKYYNLLGDKAEAYYTDILRKFKFPEIANEKFISEGVVWDEIAVSGYKIRWFNEVIYICDYLDDGLTNQGMKIYKNNPVGYLLFIRNVMKYEHPSIRNRLENYYGYYDSVKDKLSLKEIADNLLISIWTLKFTIMVKNMRDKFKKGE